MKQPKFKTVSDKLCLKDSLSLNLKVLKFLGYWHSQQNLQTWQKYLYKTYSAFMVHLLVLYVFQEVVSMYFALGDMEETITVSFIFLTHCAELVKIYFFLSRSKDVKELIEGLEQPSFQPKNEYQMKMANDVVKSCRRLYIAYNAVAFFTIGLFGIKDKNQEGKERELPMNAYIPFDAKQRFAKIVVVRERIYSKVYLQNNSI